MIRYIYPQSPLIYYYEGEKEIAVPPMEPAVFSSIMLAGGSIITLLHAYNYRYEVRIAVKRFFDIFSPYDETIEKVSLIIGTSALTLGSITLFCFS